MSSYLQDEESPFDEVFKETPKKEEEKKEEENKEEGLLGIEHPKQSAPFLEAKENVLPPSNEKFQERNLEPEKKPSEGGDILSQVGTDKFQERDLLGGEKPAPENVKEETKPIEESAPSENKQQAEEKMEVSENSEKPETTTSEIPEQEPPSPSISESNEEKETPEKDRYISLITDLLKKGYYTPAIEAIKEMKEVIK